MDEAPQKVTVFLLDDHELVREGVRQLLEADGTIEVVGEAGTCADAVARIRATRPQVAVLDVQLPDGSGVEVCRDVRSMRPDLVCLMLTSFSDEEALFQSVMAGAAGYVLKQIRGNDLVSAVHRVARGESLIDPAVTGQLLDRLRNPHNDQDPRLGALTDLERTILDYVAEGLTNRQVKIFPDHAVILATLIQTFAATRQVSFYNLAFITSDSQFSGGTGELLNHYAGACLLCVIGIMLLIWKLAARFGRPRPLILTQGRSYDEFVYSMANLFQQAKIQQIVLDNLWRDLLKIMVELTQLPVDTAPDLLIARLNRITGHHYDPMLAFYPQGNRLGKNFPKQQFLRIALQLDAYRKELTEWKKSNHFGSG